MELKQIEINKISYSIKINKILPTIHSKGVIYSKSLLSVSDEEILKSLKAQNVSEIYRFKKHLFDGSLIDSGSFALTFLSKMRPDMIRISFLNLHVYPLLQKPMQCNHCMLIGHTMKKCKASHETYCKTCFHRTPNDQTHDCIEVCKNCRGSHFSNVKTCPVYIKEKMILQLKSSEQISYFEAKKRLNNTEPSCNSTAEVSKFTTELKELEFERHQLQLLNGK